MDKTWPTKHKDLQIAQTIMEQYARSQNSEALSLFEIVVNTNEKCMDYRLSSWVVELAERFNNMYGANLGENITRMVISSCLTQGQTLH